MCICFTLSRIHSLAWASTVYSTPSDVQEWIGDDGDLVATFSDADLDGKIDELVSYDYIPMLMSSGDDVYYHWISNTVNYSKISIYMNYYDVNGGYHNIKTSVGSDGHFNLTRPDNYYRFDRMGVNIWSGALPPSGSYRMEVCINPDAGGCNYYSGCRVGYSALYNNAVTMYPESVVSSYAQDGFGSVYLDTTIDVSRQSINVIFTSSETFAFNFNGAVAVKFTRLVSGETGDVKDPYSSADDAANDTANNTAQIADNTASMADSLKEIVGTISNQLAALWDQMYNLMHVPQLANDDKNTDRLISSGQQNTEQVTGAIEQHGNFIIEGLKSLFIPSDEFFKSWFDDMYSFFNDRLGFLMLPIDVLIQFIDIFTSSTDEFSGIPFPEFKWLDGTVVIPKQTVRFEFLDTDWGKDIQTKLYFVGDVIMIGALFHLIQQKMKEVTER